MTSEAPLWVFVRDTYHEHKLWLEGAQISGVTRRHPFLAPLNAAAREIAGPGHDPGHGDRMVEAGKRDVERVTALNERPPFSCLEVSERSANGNPVWRHRRTEHAAGNQAERPRYRYVGITSPCLVYGTVMWRNQTFEHLGWPTEDEALPANPAAENVVAYYKANKDDPRLPFTAWDTEHECLNAIPSEARAASDEMPAELLQPGVYDRNPDRPSAQVRARIDKAARG